MSESLFLLHEVEHRIWDVLISEGWKILFRVTAVMWLRLLGPVISSTDTEVVLANYKRSLRRLVDHQALINAAVLDLGSVSRKELTKLRVRAATELKMSDRTQQPSLRPWPVESPEDTVHVDAINVADSQN